MPWRKILLLLTDWARVNGRYFADTGQRNRLREVLKVGGLTPAQHATSAAEEVAAPVGARPFAGLASTSLTLAGIRFSDNSRPRLNLVIGEVREGGVFAGIHTALTAGQLLAARLGLPLRVVMVDFTSPGNTRAGAEAFIEATLGIPVTVVTRESLRDNSFSKADVWLATHWKTAHAVQVACAAGVIDPGRVAYLIQDYEPGFSPWSTESVLARSTYHAGFVPVVNSTPLCTYLCEQERIEIDPALVFGPSFELDRLRETAAARRPHDEVTVLFYARPTKHRNLYRVGIAALRTAVAGLHGAPVRFFSAGEPHDPVDLGGGHMLESLGRLAWTDYFAFLSRTQVLLSLQQSPHPSHPPFDAAISGAIAVTNEFAGTRRGLHTRILAVPTDPESLGAAVLAAVTTSAGAAPAGFLPVEDGLLGGKLDAALGVAVASLRLG